MGKRLPTHDQPGASAAAEGRRARRGAARRRRVTTMLGLGAILLAATGLAATALTATGPTVPGLTASGRLPLLTAALVMAVLAWRCRPDPDPGRWERAAVGEGDTARLLARLPRRFVVLHDRRQALGRGNLDHLVIGPSGVWLIDSKVRLARIRIRRGQVWAGNYPLDVSPVARQATRLAGELGVIVTPIVAVHGTGLRRRGKRVQGVRILPAIRLVRQLRRGRRLWPSEIVALAAEADRLFPRY